MGICGDLRDFRETAGFFCVTGEGGHVEPPQRIMAGKLTYQQAGVDTRKAAALVGDIGTHVRRTQQTRKLWGAFGLFAACYDLSAYKEPVIDDRLRRRRDEAGAAAWSTICSKPPARTWWR